MTGKEHGNGWLWPLQARPYITLHHTLAVMSIDDNGKRKKEGNRKNPYWSLELVDVWYNCSSGVSMSMCYVVLGWMVFCVVVSGLGTEPGF